MRAAVRGSVPGYSVPGLVISPNRLLSNALTASRFPGSKTVKLVVRIIERKYYVPNFSRHLFDLCALKRGPVLKKIGERRRIRFRFADPMMQPFVIIHAVKFVEPISASNPLPSGKSSTTLCRRWESFSRSQNPVR